MAQQNNNKKKKNYDFYEKKRGNRKQEKHNKNYMLSLHKYIYFGFFFGVYHNTKFEIIYDTRND